MGLYATFLQFLFLFASIDMIDAWTCKYGRGACVTSCIAQNCATGYCPNGDNGVCVCSRCGTGPPIPH